MAYGIEFSLNCYST